MKVVSLFSGIGGLDLGLSQAGHKVILMCEVDPGAQQVLRSRFPGTLLVPDIIGLQTLPPETELVTAGFPCIDISRAGLKRGIHTGQNSSLIRHVFRLLDGAIQQNRPVPWVLFENVEALLERQGGRQPAVHFVTAALEALGYSSWAQRTVCSAAFGLPSRRRRVFILASWNGDARDVLLAQGALACTGGCQLQNRDVDRANKECYECFAANEDADAAECNIVMDLGNARSAPGVDLVPTFTTCNRRMCVLLATGKMGMLRIEDAERLQGFPPGWTEAAWPILSSTVMGSTRVNAEQDAERAASSRFGLIGNAVTVQVAEWLGQRLLRPYRHKFVPSHDDVPLPAKLQTTQALDAGGDDDGGADADDTSLLVVKRAARADGASELGGLDNTEADGASDDGMDDGHGGRGAKGAGSGVAGVTGEDQDGQKSVSELCLECGDRDGADPCVVPKGRSRSRTSHSHQTWPRAAWWLVGGLRRSSQSCDAPVKAALVPLHEFLHVLGPGPTRMELNTYLARLREQGWNVIEIVQKAVKCGALEDAAIAQIVRLAGVQAERECLGELVWAPIPESQKLLWPAEVLDVACLPKGRSVPREAWAALNLSERNVLDMHIRDRQTSAVPRRAGNSSSTRGRTSPEGTQAASEVFASQDSDATHVNNNRVESSGRRGPETELLAPQQPQASLSAQKLKPPDVAPHSQQNGTPSTLALGAKATRSSAKPAAECASGAMQQDSGFTTPQKAERRAPVDHGSSSQRRSRRKSARLAADAPPAASPAATAPASHPSPTRVDDIARGASVPAAMEPEAHCERPDEPGAEDDHGGAEQGGGMPSSTATVSEAAAALDVDAGNGGSVGGGGCSAMYSSAMSRLAGGCKRPRNTQSRLCNVPKVFVMFYGTNRWCWLYKSEVVGYVEHRAVQLSLAKSLHSESKLPHPVAFFSAVREADSFHALQTADTKSTAFAAASAARASTLAATVNAAPRCRACTACINVMSNGQRRCLLVRAHAAAAAGHAGAQLAVLGAAAVGARLAVWWCLDEEWYNGVVAGYDEKQVSHQVCYDDGDVELVQLWQPMQQVKLLNKREEFSEVAAKLREKGEQEAARAAAHRQMLQQEAQLEGGMVVAGAVGSGPDGDLGSDDDKPELERIRSERVKARRAKAQALLARCR